jgi:uncharacterized membrane protein
MPEQRARARSLKARIDESRTTTEKIADRISGLFGSNAFLIVNVLWFATWSLWNGGYIPGARVFDPFPFGLLTMIVSLEAILLSIFVLIAQSRAERVAELRAEVDLEVNKITEEELTKELELVVKIAAKQGIDVSQDTVLQSMLSPTNVQKLERVLDDEIGNGTILRDA